MGNYVEPDTLQSAGIAPESDDAQMWDRLAEAVSRLFDRECNVPDNFFDVAPIAGSETTKTFRTNGTEFLGIGPYIADSITDLTIDGGDRLSDGTYHELDGYLIFDSDVPIPGLVVSVSARFGFSTIAADITQACLEQALFMWRRKDPSFTELAGVSSAVITARMSPTFEFASERYRGLYSQNSYFA